MVVVKKKEEGGKNGMRYSSDVHRLSTCEKIPHRPYLLGQPLNYLLKA